MSIEYSSLYKNFQSIIGSYQDIAAIYTKLFSQGQIQKLGSVITEIYDEEHVFTLTELQKYCIESRQKEDDFVAEQYEMNSSIFRRNLTLIVQNLVEEIGKKYLDRFRQDFVSASNVEREENQSEPVEQVVEEEEEVPEQEQEVAHQRIAEPQIQERMEINERKTNANRIESKSLVLEGENKANGNKSFDINMNELAHKAKVQVHKTSQSANEISSQVSRPQSVENYQSNKKVSPVNYEFEDNSKQVSPSYNKADGSTFAYSEAKGEEYSQYDNETGAFRLSQEKFHSASRNKPNQETYQFWSSSEKNSVQERQTYSSPQEAKVASPEKFGASMFGYSYSKWSTTNGRPDMSILDSEFSYGQGRSFSKSPKKFHHRIQDIPGPGRYELEESMQYTKATSPNRSFTKSPKTPSYFKKSAVPGAIYYPTKHFLSK